MTSRRTSRKGNQMPRHTLAERIFLLLGPFSPESTAALLRAIATQGREVDACIAGIYTRFLDYASRTTYPRTFMLQIAACLQRGISQDTAPDGP